MKRAIFCLSLLASYSIWALHPKLEKAVRLVEGCLRNEEIPLCDSKIDEELKAVHMDARGEFVYFLKTQMEKKGNEKIISNLFVNLQAMIPYYEYLDGKANWSTRDLKMLFGEVSIRYVKNSPVDTELLKTVYKAQSLQSARYGILMTLFEKVEHPISLAEMDKLAEFVKFAKNYSLQLGDEKYLYKTSEELIERISLKSHRNFRLIVNN